MKNELPPLSQGIDIILGVHLINCEARRLKRKAETMRAARLYLQQDELNEASLRLYELKAVALKRMMLKREEGLYRIVPDDIPGYVKLGGMTLMGWFGFHAKIGIVGSAGAALPKVGIPSTAIRIYKKSELPEGYDDIQKVICIVKKYLHSDDVLLPKSIRKKIAAGKLVHPRYKLAESLPLK